jgi:hypothetical protein
MNLGRPRTLALWALGLALSASACRNQNQVVVPNRVLDRPQDVALACVRASDDGVEVLALNVCSGSTNNDCSADGPQLVGFVTNSERNEVAMFRKCDRNGLVDLDPESPGYSFVPVGELPSRITRTTDSCFVVSANAGSCDLSVIDVPGLASYALGIADPRAPSALVTTIIPRRGDGTPLGATPGDILAVPPEYSRTTLEGDGPGDDAGDTTDGTDPVDTAGDTDPFAEDGGGGDATAAEPPLAEGLTCDAQSSHGVWVTFPNCQLLAEVSLQTQRILQSRRFVTQPDGSVILEDAGPDPVCPIDCPAQFPEGVPDSPPVASEGVFPVTLAFVEPIEPLDESDTLDPAEELVTYPALFVGGTGNDHVFEIPIDGRDFADPAASPMLELETPQGIHGIRISPPGLVLGEPHQFLYVIAGDGSTHVVDRNFDEGVLGTECDTQVDPTQVPASACHPIDPNAFGNAPDRRPFAVGPGIRTSDGSTINDWSFHKVEAAGEVDPADLSSAPFGSPGIVAVGVTSFGPLVYSHLGQYQDLGLSATLPSIDPVGTMNVGVRPHMLWPSIDPHSGAIEALPRVADSEPGRSIPGDGRDSQFLAPNLRRIDRAYALPEDFENASAERRELSERLGDDDCDLTPETLNDRNKPCVRNVDQLAGFGDTLIYENDVARVAVRDYQLWDSRSWRLEWEGQISSGGQTGIVQCDNHGGVDDDGDVFAGGTCRSIESGDTRIVDEGATFCEDGILAGDTVGILGCLDDDGCGLGQKCLREPTAPASATGICVSEQAYDADFDSLRVLCSPFISDPCGLPQRRFRIVRAFERELWLQAVDRPRDVVLRNMGSDEVPDLREYEAKLSCAAPIVHRGTPPCTSDDECQEDPYAPGEQRSAWFCDRAEGEAEGVCRGTQPDAGCVVDSDCFGLGASYVCVDDLCRAPCDLCPPPSQPEEPCVDDADCGAGETCFAGTCHVPCEDDSPGCIETPLPGPFCFPEFVRYDVRASNSFVVTGTNTGVFADGVRTDDATGECLPDPTVSSLLTSRLWLGADEDETFNHPVLGIPDCPNPLRAEPGDPNPCRITTPRSGDSSSLFHTFAYHGTASVEAIRFSNPFFSLTLDLVSLLDLAAEVPDLPGTSWPLSFARYRRSRIPRGYALDFGTQDGYLPYNEPLVVANLTPVTYPVRIINAPELSVAYVVDAGGRGGVQGVRGQIVRVLLGDDTRADENFRVQ